MTELPRPDVSTEPSPEQVPGPIPAPEPRTAADTGYDRAFAVADRLAVHGADCVCPRCAGRLPGLLSELARALDDTVGRAGR